MSREDRGPPAATPSTFGTATAVFVVVSSMVGVGVLTTSGYTVAALGSNSLMLALWVVGGGIALCGALTLAELAAALPRSGGEYVILSVAYGPLAGFLAGWASFLLGFAAPIAAVASAAAGYLLEPLGLGPDAQRGLATVAIVTFAMAHALGRRGTIGVQGVVSLLTLILLGLYLVGGLATGWRRVENLADLPRLQVRQLPHAVTALVYISYAYTGWNGAAYIAGEVENPGRRLPRAILAGTGLVVLLYLGLNLVYALALPAREIQELARVDGDAVQPIAALAARRLWGDKVSAGLSCAFGLVLLASLSALVLTGSRVLLAMAQDRMFPAIAARLSGKAQTPTVATLLLSAVSLGLLWSGSFRDLVVFASVGLALSSMAAVGAVFVLRQTHPDLPRAFLTPGYPFVPAVFLLASGLLIAAALTDPVQGPPARWSLLGILLGVPIYGLMRWFGGGPGPRSNA